MSTYRSWRSFEQRFGRQRSGEAGASPFTVTRYLQHQGQKLVERFDANAYIRLTEAMDSHDLGRDRGLYESVLRSIPQPTLIVSIDTDVLYPSSEQQELASLIPNAYLEWLYSPHGHDAFLIDMETLNDLVVSFKRSLQSVSDLLEA